jgi:hypothetical protein
MSTPQEQPTTSELDEESWQDATDVGNETARTAWAEAARGILADAARHYGSTVSHKEMSTLVQESTRIRTRQPAHYWIGDVLGRVARDCAGRDEPMLSSLCVNAQGSVGADYAPVVAELTGTPIPDGDDHAAHERLACHRHFEATMPASGGHAQLTDRLAAARTRSRKAAKEARPADVCPSCNMALPATGECDSCG